MYKEIDEAEKSEMEIKEISKIENREFWLDKIAESDWSAGKYLYSILRDYSFYDLCGTESKVFLLTEGGKLISFCTFAERDDIPNMDLSPWIGFVYTFHSFRGKRRIGKLIEYIYLYAKKKGYKNIYISTDQKGLYENFGFKFFREMKDRSNEMSLVYKMDIETKDYSNVIGRWVKGKIDRPLGSCHPRYKDMIYPINYGYVENVFARDGAEQDVYILGSDKPLESYEGKVIAVLHRLNDVEDKWVVSLDGMNYSDKEIMSAVSFQEQYFMSELYR